MTDNDATLAPAPPTIDATADLVPRRDDLFLVARNQMEMQACQARLVSWFARKLQHTRIQVTELEETVAAAIKYKWRVSAIRKQLNYTRAMVTFFEKCKAAAEDGYAIIPDLPCDVFAIRVDPKLGVDRDHQTSHRPDWIQLSDQPSDKLPLGDGEYKSPSPTFLSGNYEKNAEGGKKEIVHWRAAADFQAVAFPVIAARPKIMTAAKEAMAKKLFDEVAIVPEGSIRKRRVDPMIVGRVLGPKRGYKVPVVSFIICWFLNLEDLAQ